VAAPAMTPLAAAPARAHDVPPGRGQQQQQQQQQGQIWPSRARECSRRPRDGTAAAAWRPHMTGCAACQQPARGLTCAFMCHSTRTGASAASAAASSAAQQHRRQPRGPSARGHTCTHMMHVSRSSFT
jgi:hypothetical protein